VSDDFRDLARAYATDAARLAQTPWLGDFRSRGATRFATLPLPTLKTEHWKYTSLRGLYEADLLHAPPTTAAIEDVLPDVGNRIVVVNGQYLAAASRASNRKAIEFTSFEEATGEQRETITRHLGTIADDAEHPFLALNEGMTTDGVLVRVRGGAAPAEPLHIVHVDSGMGVSRFTRVLIVLEPASELTLVEQHLNAASDEASPRECFTSAVTELELMNDARLTHARIQSGQAPGYQIVGAYANLERCAHYALHQCTLGSRMTRNDIRVRMLGPGASCVLNGIYLCRERQHVDNHTTIEHSAPHCTSQEDFHGIVVDRARAVFNGRVHIHPGAEQSAARLDNRNLLLSADAEVDTKPELEIYADDVKCSHGATVGELDADARFYLMSRGIDRDTTENLLIRGFAKARIDEMPVAWVRERVQQLLFPRLEIHREH
jgi:Fe-S cluster assembly protein SufD